MGRGLRQREHEQQGAPGNSVSLLGSSKLSDVPLSRLLSLRLRARVALWQPDWWQLGTRVPPDDWCFLTLPFSRCRGAASRIHPVFKHVLPRPEGLSVSGIRFTGACVHSLTRAFHKDLGSVGDVSDAVPGAGNRAVKNRCAELPALVGRAS